MSLHRSTRLRCAGLALAAFSLAACGGGDTAETAESPDPGISEAVTETLAATDPGTPEAEADDTSTSDATDDSPAAGDVEIPNGFPTGALVDGTVFKASGDALFFAEVSVRTDTEGQSTIDAAFAAVEADGWVDDNNRSLLDTDASPPFATGYVTYAKDGATLTVTFKLNDIGDGDGEDFQVVKYTLET